MTIGEIISEGMDVHFKLTDKEKNDKVAELLNKVGLSADYANRFAHELSGRSASACRNCPRTGIFRQFPFILSFRSFFSCDGPQIDDHFTEAGYLVIDKQKATIGMLQRVYKIGFNRAARIMDQL